VVKRAAENDSGASIFPASAILEICWFSASSNKEMFYSGKPLKDYIIFLAQN